MVNINRNLEILCHIEKPSSYIRRQLAKLECAPPVERITKWGDELGLEIDTGEWLENFSTIGNTTAVTQVRSFAYRFQVRDVMTNNELFKMKLCNTVTCYLCNNSIETITHLY